MPWPGHGERWAGAASVGWMIVQLAALTVDAAAPLRLATFWAGLLGWRPDPADATVIVPHDDTGFVIRFLPSDAPKVVANQVHLDLRSGSQQEQDDTVARALALGGRHIDIGQLPEEEHVVLADPEGNELCVVEAGNGFLADCPFVGCLSSDGTRDLGRFWSVALDWPLVWDQDEETAIRSAHGGPKISWGGPPLAPKAARCRWRLELSAPAADLAVEVDRLVGLGATRLGRGPDADGVVAMADPDGNEFAIRNA